MKRKLVLLLCPVLLAAPAGSLLAAATAPDAPFPLYRSTLANGLQVWVQPRTDSESVAALLVLGAGARYETAANNGVSHYVEHMVFTGTERWTEEQVKEAITRRGGRYNGWTGLEQTTYYAHLAATDLDLALDWLAEVVFHPTFPADKVDKEREVIFQERWGRYGWLINSLDRWGFGYDLGRDVRRALFPGSSLGLDVIGEDASLESLDRAALLDYYHRHYTPANAALIVVGNVEAGQVQELAAKYLGALPGAGGAPEQPDTPPLPAAGPQRVVVRGPLPTARVELMVGARTVGRTHPDHWPLEVLARLLDEELTEEIRYRRGLVYGLHAYNYSLDDTGYFAISTDSDRQQRAAIQDEIEAALARVRRGEVDAAALAEAQAALKGNWALAMEDNAERAFWLAGWASVLAADQPLPDYAAEIEAVTAADLARVVGLYFIPQRSFVGLHQPVVTVASAARIVAGALALGAGAWLGLRLLDRKKT